MNPPQPGSGIPGPNPNQPQQPYYGQPVSQNPSVGPQAPPPFLPPDGAPHYAPNYPPGPGSQPSAPPAGPVSADHPDHPLRQYDFILDPNQAQHSLSLGGSKVKRILVALGGVSVLVVAAAIFFSAINRSPVNATILLAVAQQQTEVGRVAAIGTKSAGEQSTRNIAYATQFSIATAEQQLLTYFGTVHIKADAKILGQKKNAQVDLLLTKALTSDTFDSTFTTVIQQDLANYIQALQKAYQSHPGPRGEALLKKQLQGAQLLLEQSKQ